MIETIDDIVEDLADKLGIYGGHGDDDGDVRNCNCRCCFRSDMTTRIRAACRVEQKLGYWE